LSFFFMIFPLFSLFFLLRRSNGPIKNGVTPFSPLFFLFSFSLRFSFPFFPSPSDRTIYLGKIRAFLSFFFFFFFFELGLFSFFPFCKTWFGASAKSIFFFPPPPFCPIHSGWAIFEIIINRPLLFFSFFPPFFLGPFSWPSPPLLPFSLFF